MTAQTFSDALGEINEKYIMEAIAYEGKPIRRADHPIRHRVAQVAVCILLVALLSGCAVLAISPEARAAFVGWIREVHETWFVYRHEGVDQQLPKDVAFQPTWVPDGFTESRRSESGDLVYFIYEDEDWKQISFVYTQNVESSTLYMQRDEVDAQTVQVGDLEADLYIDQNIGNANDLVWIDADTLFWLHGNCSGDELIKIAESIVAQEIPEQEMS